MEKLIEKIMKTMGLVHSCEYYRVIPYQSVVCTYTKVYHRKNPKELEVEFYMCWKYHKGKVSLEESNIIKNTTDSIYFNFGEKNEVFNYFKNKSREFAIDYFKNELSEEVIRRIIKKIIK